MIKGRTVFQSHIQLGVAVAEYAFRPLVRTVLLHQVLSWALNKLGIFDLGQNKVDCKQNRIGIRFIGCADILELFSSILNQKSSQRKSFFADRTVYLTTSTCYPGISRALILSKMKGHERDEKLAELIITLLTSFSKRGGHTSNTFGVALVWPPSCKR